MKFKYNLYHVPNSCKNQLISCQVISSFENLNTLSAGGGKGIRKVKSEDEFDLAYHQVQSEIPGSPIFIMQLAHK